MIYESKGMINELINWKVCPVMSRANLDFQTPYSGLTYCNEGFIQVYLDMDKRYPSKDRPKVKCQAWHETNGCSSCKNNVMFL